MRPPRPPRPPRFRLVAIALVAMASMGCAAGTPSGAVETPGGSAEVALPGATEPGRSTAAPSHPSPVPASISFTFESEVPTVTRELAGLDERYINPGAVIEHDGTLHMFANLFTAWPGHVSVVHLRSADGVLWALAEPKPVLTSDDVPFTSTGIDVSSGFVDADGRWVLIFETVESSAPWVIGRATAPGPDGPWAVDPEPILVGAAGEWDADGLSWPSVVAADDGYAMYYTGVDRPRGKGAIGLATSPDGKTWARHPGPVFQAEAAWELGKLDRPRVAMTPRGLAMVYAGGRLTDRGLAWSADGVSWRRDGDGPVIDQDRYPVEGRAWDAALLHRDGQLLYYLEIGFASGSAGTQVYLATALIP